MRRRTLFIGGGVAAVALALTFVGLKVSHHSAWAHGGHHMAGSMSGGMMHFCSSDQGAHFDRLSGHLKSELDLDGAQLAAWDDLASVWRHSETTMRASCAAIENSAETQGVGGLLARAEIQIKSGLTAVRTLRPAFEQFHATLNVEQQGKLDSFGHR